MKKQKNEQGNKEPDVNNGKAGNPVVNQNPTKDGNVEQPVPAGRPDKTINDTQGKEEQESKKKV